MSYFIHHIGFAVQDIDDNLNSWFHLGYLAKTEKIEELEIGVQCILLQDSNSMYIELVQPLPGSAALTSRLRRGGGLDHICYSVINIEEAILFEIAQGGFLVTPLTDSALHGAQIAFIYRKSGLLVELLNSPSLRRI